MGWASGAIILDDIWEVIKSCGIKDKDKLCLLARKLIKVFEENDCDIIMDAEPYGFLIEKDNSYLEEKLKEEKEWGTTKEELFECYEQWGEERVLKIVNKLYD